MSALTDRLSLDECINEVCPWSGDRVSADALTLYKGQVVGFCNPSCREKFEKAVTHFDARLDRSKALKA